MSESYSNLKKSILSGMIWTGGGQTIAAALRIIFMIVLARLLSPDYFGLLSMAVAVMVIFRNISDLGFGSALVQKEQIGAIDLATVFWFNLILSFVVLGIIFVFSGWLAWLLGDVRMIPVLKGLAILLPINALSMVPNALLQRSLQFGKLAWRDIIGIASFGLVGIVMAVVGMEMWSLIGALAAQWLSRSIYIIIISPYRPVWIFSIHHLRSLARFSLWMFISNTAWQLMNNLDYFLIGHFLGATMLGYYSLAFQLVITPIQRLVHISSVVLFPSFSKIQGKQKQFRRGFLQLMKILAWILAPISGFLLVAAELIIILIYSEKWIQVVPIIRILSIVGFFYGLDITNALFNAIGKPYWRFIVLIIRASIFMVITLSWGLSQGIIGVAVSVLVAVVITSTGQVWLLTHEIQLNPITFWKIIKISVAGALIAVAGTWYAMHIFIFDSEFINILFTFLLFGGIYSIITLPKYHTDLQAILLELR